MAAALPEGESKDEEMGEGGPPEEFKDMQKSEEHGCGVSCMGCRRGFIQCCHWASSCLADVLVSGVLEGMRQSAVWRRLGGMRVLCVGVLWRGRRWQLGRRASMPCRREYGCVVWVGVHLVLVCV